MAPEIEAIEEVSPDDVLILVPPAGRDAAAAAAVDDDDDDADDGVEGELDEEEQEDEEEDEAVVVGERGREQVLEDGLAAAQRAGRFVDISQEPDDEPPPSVPGKKRKRAEPKKAGAASMEAVLAAEDVPRAPVGPSAPLGVGAAAAGGGGDGAADGADLRALRARIQKMLRRGLHPATPDAEAAASMRLAQKLLARHNLDQADVLDEGGAPAELRGGAARVHLRATRPPHAPLRTAAWMHDVAHAAADNFECKYYYESWHHAAAKRCDFVFYGLATNAALAAFSFAACFNRCALLSAAHDVPAGEFERRQRLHLQRVPGGTAIRTKGAYTARARESYRDGLARGLLDAADAGIKIRKGGGYTERTERRRESFEQGVTDSRQIDVNQRTITVEDHKPQL